MSSEHRVAVVVDAGLASVIPELAQSRHVWAVRTPETEKIAERVWRDQQPGEDQWNEKGLTLFNGDAAPEKSLLSILDSVELHHGEYSHDPPLSVIEVRGADLTEAIRQALAALGFTEMRPIGIGFIARRPA